MRTIKLAQYLKNPADPAIVALKTAHESITSHDHDFYELVYISDGYCLHDMAGRMTLLMAGDLFIIPPGKAHRYMCNRDIKLYNCMFREEAFSAFSESLNNVPGLCGLTNPSFDGFMHAHLELQERSAVTQLLEDLSLGYADALLRRFSDHPLRAHLPASCGRHARKARLYGLCDPGAAVH